MSFCRHLTVLPILLIVFLLLSFIYLRRQSSYLWNLSLASAAITPVRWFIGDDDGDVENPRWNPRDDEKPASSEGVEFYRNDWDFYEGEFYKGKCRGSGVYNFSR
ncbi:hypothetical protein KSP39_PZI010395 [Platanthera zijinensis]|uniref:Uncharacterized protein n=1 Tax=Platanthera zijinensis TaxID=2320716 RepID=A0AAP0G6N6_9ASPA